MQTTLLERPATLLYRGTAAVQSGSPMSWRYRQQMSGLSRPHAGLGLATVPSGGPGHRRRLSEGLRPTMDHLRTLPQLLTLISREGPQISV